MPMAPGLKKPSPTDVHVGSRVRTRRMMLKLSQEKLGDALGVTFQQVQKYEKGANRIGSSRLQQLCTVLGVPITYFFEGLPGTGQHKATLKNDEGVSLSIEALNEFLASRDGINLVVAFIAIKSPKAKRAALNLVTGLSK